jgi:hypothetical protein
MNIFGNGKKNLTWGDLYKIQEIISDSGDINKILVKCKISKKDFKNFKLNCNSHVSAGEESRHHLDELTGNNPEFKIKFITKSEAYYLVRNLLVNWAEILTCPPIIGL